ncbi:hypothetical protein EG827_11720 [bacterium]|jgi:endo-1,4-beta-D-glucanase Y|nr:hypothetical protein [bacterium]
MKTSGNFSIQEKRAINLFFSIALVTAGWNRQDNDINSAELQASSAENVVAVDNSEHNLEGII